MEYSLRFGLKTAENSRSDFDWPQETWLQGSFASCHPQTSVNYYTVQWVQACKALWPNCPIAQSRESRTLLCKKYVLLLCSMSSNLLTTHGCKINICWLLYLVAHYSKWFVKESSAMSSCTTNNKIWACPIVWGCCCCFLFLLGYCSISLVICPEGEHTL